MEPLILGAVGAYLAAFVASFRWDRWAYAAAAGGLVPHAVAIARRWQEQGHGPYLGLYDSLSSNLWIQLALFLLLAAISPPVRRARTAALGVVALFAAWLPFAPAEPVALPPTFDTGWFYAHVYAGKLGYALLFAAAVLAGARPRDDTGERLMLAAFVCYTAMLLSGAAWAYAAWGGYWDWNALEVWTLLTWFAFGLYFHRRRPAPGTRGIAAQRLAVAVYVLAVLAFYGVPFLSRVSHQGLS